MTKTRFIELDKHKRAYDGKWEVLAKVLDHDNAYRYTTESGQIITYTPEKWITIDVRDTEPKELPNV